jgi:hypothetical protein
VAVSGIVARCVARSAHSLLRAAESGGAGLRYAGIGRLAPGHGRPAAFFDIRRLFPCAGLFSAVISPPASAPTTSTLAAIDRGITVAEVTYSSSISVSEHVVMMILGLVRNYIPSYQWVVKGRLEKLAGTGAHSYSTGDATGGSEEAAKFENAM